MKKISSLFFFLLQLLQISEAVLNFELHVISYVCKNAFIRSTAYFHTHPWQINYNKLVFTSVWERGGNSVDRCGSIEKKLSRTVSYNTTQLSGLFVNGSSRLVTPVKDFYFLVVKYLSAMVITPHFIAFQLSFFKTMSAFFCGIFRSPSSCPGFSVHSWKKKTARLLLKELNMAGRVLAAFNWKHAAFETASSFFF